MLDFGKLKEYVNETNIEVSNEGIKPLGDLSQLDLTRDEYSHDHLTDKMESICKKFIKFNDNKELIKTNKEVKRRGDKTDATILGSSFIKAYNERYANLNNFFLKFTEKCITKWSNPEKLLLKRRLETLKKDRSKFKGWGIESNIFPNKNGNQLERKSDLAIRSKRKHKHN